VSEESAEVARAREEERIRTLEWVRDRFNLDTEDVDALNEAIEKGLWE
jgi:hypothetical protein